MLISRIENNGVHYINLHAEQVYIWTYEKKNLDNKKSLDVNSRGYYINQITEEVFEKIIKWLETLTLKPNLVIDFSGKDYTSKNSAQKIMDFLCAKCNLIVLNINSNSATNLDINIGVEHFKEFIYLGDGTIFTYKTPLEVFNEEYSTILFDVSDDLDNFEPPSSNSAIYLTKYINVKKIIFKYNGFVFYSIYLLIEKLTKLKSKDGNWQLGEFEDITLVCQNMNSAYLTSIISDIVNVNLLIIDHLGPLNKLYKVLANKIERNKKYVIVSDVFCLGTEHKIAKNIIEFAGGICLGNISLISINTLKDEHLDKNNCTAFSINESNSSKLGYQIYSALK